MERQDIMYALPAGFKYKAAFIAGRPRHQRFDAFSLKHPQMDRRKRAKIFAPFDALDGYSESIEEKNIEYVERIEQDPSAKAELNRRLRILQSLTYNSRIAMENNVVVSVRYYVPCTDTNRFAYQMKGRYVTVTGVCMKVDLEVDGTIKIGEAVIPLDDVTEITSSDKGLFAEDDWGSC